MLNLLKQNRLALGVIAGLLSAVFMVAGEVAPVLSTPLMLLSFACISAAALAGNAPVALLALLVSAGAMAVGHGSTEVFLGLAPMLAPAAVIALLANLARPADEIGGPSRLMAWYPLSDMLMWTAIASALASFVVLAMSPHQAEFQKIVHDEVIRMFGEMNPNLTIDAATDEMIRTMIAVMMPISQAGQLVLVSLGGYYIAARATLAAGLSVRPREDFPASLRMHPLGALIFGAGLVVMFFGQPLAMIGAHLFGAFAMGFMVAGFAVLHHRLRDKSWAMPVLVLVYGVTAIISLPILIFMVVGLLNTRRSMAVTPLDDNPGQPG